MLAITLVHKSATEPSQDSLVSERNKSELHSGEMKAISNPPGHTTVSSDSVGANPLVACEHTEAAGR